MVAGEHGNRRHQTAQLRVRIVELRDEGLSFREIAAEVSLSLATVWQHYQTAMRNIPAAAVAAHAETVARRREEQLRRIDMERETVMAILEKNGRTVVTPSGKVVENVEDDSTILSAVDRLIKLDEQEAGLLGLKAKTQVEHSGELTYRIHGVNPAELA